MFTADPKHVTTESSVAAKYHGRLLHEAPQRKPLMRLDEVIAGDDDRRDYCDLDGLNVSKTLVRRLVASTVVLTWKANLSREKNGGYRLQTSPFRRHGLPACGGERFSNQHVGGWGSGFLVGADIMVTAGHCISPAPDVSQIAFVFGLRVPEAGHPGTTSFLASQIYFGREVLVHEESSSGDYAIVRTDRRIEVPSAKPLQVRTMGQLRVGANVGVIGHPSGLPVKVAFGSDTRVIAHEGPWLRANLDTYGGNSGSPVFNTDGTVEGILVRGQRDYEVDSSSRCFRSRRVPNAEGREYATQARTFAHDIP